MNAPAAPATVSLVAMEIEAVYGGNCTEEPAPAKSKESVAPPHLREGCAP